MNNQNIDENKGPDGICGSINCKSGNYNDKGFNLNNNLGTELNINLTNPQFILYNKLIDNYYSYIEMNNNIGNQGNLFTSIGLYMINNNVFLNIEDSNEIKDSLIKLNINSLLIKDNSLTNSKYTNTEINLNNIISLNLNTISFTDEYSKTNISQNNNQIIFNNVSHIDTGMEVINSLSTSTIFFTNSYPIKYKPTVILQQYNSLNFIPLLVTKITNNNFTWYSENLITCN
jgi:hypothetical protein